MRAANFPSIPLNQANMAPPRNAQLAQKEGRIALAIQALKQGQVSSINTAAKIYDIAESILRGCIKGINIRYNSIPIIEYLGPQAHTLHLLGYMTNIDIASQVYAIGLCNRSTYVCKTYVGCKLEYTYTEA